MCLALMTLLALPLIKMAGALGMVESRAIASILSVLAYAIIHWRLFVQEKAKAPELSVAQQKFKRSDEVDDG